MNRRYVEEVHRAAAPLRDPVDAPEELGHDPLWVGSARQRLAVLAVGRDEVVLLAQRVGGAHDRGLLADREVEEAAELRLRVHLAGALLEAPDEDHGAEDGLARLARGNRVRRARGIPGRDRVLLGVGVGVLLPLLRGHPRRAYPIHRAGMGVSSRA